MEERDVILHLSGLANNDAGGVVEHQSGTQGGRVDIDAKDIFIWLWK